MDVVIASNVYSDELWAEICYEHFYWAEVKYDKAKNDFVLTIFSPLDGADRQAFSLSDVQQALERAKKRLVELGYGSETQ